jgi:hypothetical protein
LRRLFRIALAAAVAGAVAAALGTGPAARGSATIGQRVTAPTGLERPLITRQAPSSFRYRLVSGHLRIEEQERTSAGGATCSGKWTLVLKATSPAPDFPVGILRIGRGGGGAITVGGSGTQVIDTTRTAPNVPAAHEHHSEAVPGISLAIIRLRSTASRVHTSWLIASNVGQSCGGGVYKEITDEDTLSAGIFRRLTVLLIAKGKRVQRTATDTRTVTWTGSLTLRRLSAD